MGNISLDSPSKYILIKTGDGSFTLKSGINGPTFKSENGAKSESRFVFVDSLINYLSILDIKDSTLKVFELGFGSGSNFLNLLEATQEIKIYLRYYSVEPYPITPDLVEKIYCKKIELLSDCFKTLQSFQVFSRIEKNFSLEVFPSTFDQAFEALAKNSFNAIFHDPFGKNFSPDLWNLETLEKEYSLLQRPGLLISYGASSEFKRNLKSIGFAVETKKGFAKKREMTIAKKLYG
jgi:tRNA U34 5-methylaminomethyl-2-thiouridine-forming methyltransferase MnmC